MRNQHRSRTGIPGLDDILHGGLIANRLYLIDGNPGAGKTTLALQYLLEGVRNGERCLYVTLSETRAELMAGAASHGWSLDGLDIRELVPSDEELDGDSHLTMYHTSEVELTETTRRVLQAVKGLATWVTPRCRRRRRGCVRRSCPRSSDAPS